MYEKYSSEEYSAIRAEILQLNSQAFTLVGGSLILNFTILGLGLGKAGLATLDPFIPFIGILVLVASNILIAHKIRMAHRLAFYQKYFLEPKMRGIKWSKVYFLFRERFDATNNRFLVSIAERFVDVQTGVIVVSQIVNVCIFLQCQYDAKYALLGIVSIVILCMQVVFLGIINNYKSVEKIFIDLANPNYETVKSKTASSVSSMNTMNEEDTRIDDFLSFIEKRIISPIDETDINESCTATLLLIFAAIDSLSKITCGDNEYKLYKEKKGNKVRFIGFLESVMNKKYKIFKEDIYNLRNDIVHTGINAKAILSKNVHNVKHLQKVNGYLWINTKQFFKDFSETFEQIKFDIKNKDTFYLNAKNRIKNFNIINIDEYDEAIPSPGPDDSFF